MKKFTLFAAMFVALFGSTMASGQDVGFGIIDSASDSALVVGSTSAQPGGVWVEYEDDFGPIGVGYGSVSDAGEFIGIAELSSASLPSGSGLTASLYSVGNGEAMGSMILIPADPTDGSDFGPGWTPYDIHNPIYWNNCLNVANNIKATLGGGDVVWVVPEDPAPLLPPYMGVTTGWHFHYVVIKDGKVYDGFTDYEGLPLDDWLDRFGDDKDAVELIYPDDDDYPDGSGSSTSI